MVKRERTRERTRERERERERKTFSDPPLPPKNPEKKPHLVIRHHLPAPQAGSLPVDFHRPPEHIVEIVEGGLDAAGDHGGPGVRVVVLGGGGEDV